MGGGGRFSTADPAINIRIGLVDQRLVTIELLRRQAGHMPIGEAPEHEVEFAGAAVPASEPQALAANMAVSFMIAHYGWNLQ